MTITLPRNTHGRSMIAVNLGSLLMISVLTIGTTGCLRKRINQQFPPINTVAKKREAIAQSREVLRSLPQVDLFATVATDDVQAIAPLVKAEIEGISSLKFALREQEIQGDIEFDKVFPIATANGGSLRVRMAGSAAVVATAFIDKGVLRITPWLCASDKSCRITLKTLQIQGKAPAPKLLVTLLVTALNSYLDNISGAIGTQSVRLDLPILATVKPADLVKGNTIVSVEGKPIDFSVQVDNGAVLIDQYGIHALAKLTENQAQINYSSNVMAASRTVGVAADAPDVASDFGELVDLFNSVGQTSFGAEFSSYRQSTGALLTKAYASGLLNDTIERQLSKNDADNPFLVKANASISYQQVPIKETEIRADQAPQLNCQLNAEKVDCNPTDDCNLNKSCDPGWPCPSCEWYQADCHVRRALCEADKGRFKAQCETEKVTFRTECEARKVFKRSACEVKKAAELTLCQANQKWLDAWSGAHFANIRGNLEFNNSKASLVVGKAALTSDAASITIQTTASADTEVVGTFDLRPVDAGHLFCPLPFGGQVRFNLALAPQAFGLSASFVEAIRDARRNLNVKFKTEPVELTLKTSAPPVGALLSQNPHFLLACYPLAQVVQALGIKDVVIKQQLPPDLVRDTFTQKIPANEFSFTVKSIELAVGAEKPGAPPPLKRNLVPLWLSKSFGFEVTK